MATPPAGNPPPSPPPTQMTESEAPSNLVGILSRRSQSKILAKRNVVKPYKLGPPFNSYPKKRKRFTRGGARNVKRPNN